VSIQTKIDLAMGSISKIPAIFIFIITLACNQWQGVSDPYETGQTPVKFAVVKSVSVKGESSNYNFRVEVQSPDTGCDQYADWWEVIDGDGKLIYRRVLLHSHVNEQPFTRSGGPVDIDSDMFVYIRAHMNNTGYGSQVMSGSVKQGFTADSLTTNFASELQNLSPLPDKCAF